MKISPVLIPLLLSAAASVVAASSTTEEEGALRGRSLREMTAADHLDQERGLRHGKKNSRAVGRTAAEKAIKGGQKKGSDKGEKDNRVKDVGVGTKQAKDNKKKVGGNKFGDSPFINNPNRSGDTYETNRASTLASTCAGTTLDVGNKIRGPPAIDNLCNKSTECMKCCCAPIYRWESDIMNDAASLSSLSLDTNAGGLLFKGYKGACLDITVNGDYSLGACMEDGDTGFSDGLQDTGLSGGFP